jgi:hypothetical protein
MVMDNSISLSRSFTPNAVPNAQPKPADGENPPPSHKLDVVQMAPMIGQVAGDLKAGEQVTVSYEGDKLVISKVGPDRWDKFKVAAADVGRTTFRVARGVVEQDPSFAFRESLEVAKNSVERILPAELSGVIGQGLYPVMRGVLTAIDIHKAVKTTTAMKEAKAKEVEQHKAGNLTYRAPIGMADKIVDYAHVGTDAAGLLAIASTMTKVHLPGAVYFAAAAVIGDIVAGGWHAMRFATQGAAMIKSAGTDEEKPLSKPSGTELEKPQPKTA